MRDPFDINDIFECIDEPPSGHNHGRSKGEASWHTLETNGDSKSFKHYVDNPRKHGTRYTYVHRKCRCDLCRSWNAAAARARRQRNVTPPKGEEV